MRSSEGEREKGWKSTAESLDIRLSIVYRRYTMASEKAC